MRLRIEKPCEVEATAIRCVLPVNYGEDDIPYDFPHRQGNLLDVTIDIDTGAIRDWPAGLGESAVNMKVVDGGSYYLMDHDTVLASIEHDYVPDCLPGDYGDYVEWHIDRRGIITNWNPAANEVVASFYRTED